MSLPMKSFPVTSGDVTSGDATSGLFRWRHEPTHDPPQILVRFNIIYYSDTIYCTLSIWPVALLLSESRAIINDLDVILHGFMVQIIYTTVFRVKTLNNLTSLVRLFNRLTVVWIITYWNTLTPYFQLCVSNMSFTYIYLCLSSFFVVFADVLVIKMT